MNHTFEYLFIPQMVENSNKHEILIDDAELFDSFGAIYTGFENIYPDKADKLDWENLIITKRITEELEYWLIEFPEPKKEDEAIMGIIVHYEEKQYRYFTLRTTADDKYVIENVKNKNQTVCETKDSRPTEKEFTDIALELARKN